MDCPTTINTLVNPATRSPTMVAFVPANDADVIYISHLLTVYPSDATNTLPYDNNLQGGW